jgi:hypothetical protein
LFFLVIEMQSVLCDVEDGYKYYIDYFWLKMFCVFFLSFVLNIYSQILIISQITLQNKTHIQKNSINEKLFCVGLHPFVLLLVP